MDRSNIKFLISELVDNRLDLATKKELEKHLKETPEDMAYYNDLLEIKQCMLIKSYERPSADYFEQLQSSIKKRILACDIISFREAAMRYISQPSWAKTAAVALILGASLFLNYKYYNFYQQRYGGGDASITQANAAIPFVPLAHSHTSLQPAINTQNITDNKQNTFPEASEDTRVYTFLTPDGQTHKVYVIKPVKVKPASSDDAYRIFQ
ncbi:hypothetical protein KDK77_04250 [bacterium]|nr:hypothetical protein [bacterium]